jgi:hypothetical protein
MSFICLEKKRKAKKGENKYATTLAENIGCG